MLGIVIPAVNIPSEIVARCYRSLSDANIKVPYRVHVVTEVFGQFTRAVARNTGIAMLFPHCDKIVCLDVDCLVPPGLIDLADRTIRDGLAVYALARSLPHFNGEYRWAEWLRQPVIEYGTSGFIGMTVRDWYDTGGFDERTRGWGAEDTLLDFQREQCRIQTFAIREFPLMHIDHAKHWGDTSENNLENLRLATSPAPTNWLAERMRATLPRRSLFLWALAACNGSCPLCSQRALRLRNPQYQMSLEDLDHLLSCIRQSRYPPFPSVVITGGEPLLWQHIREAVTRIAAADIGPIHVFTNGTEIAVAKEIDPYVAKYCLSKYDWNASQADAFYHEFQHKTELWTPTHWRMPVGPYGAETLPPTCIGAGWLVYDNHVYLCCNSPALPIYLGDKFADIPRYPVRPGFIEIMAHKECAMELYCRMCIGNKKVQKWLT